MSSICPIFTSPSDDAGYPQREAGTARVGAKTPARPSLSPPRSACQVNTVPPPHARSVDLFPAATAGCGRSCHRGTHCAQSGCAPIASGPFLTQSVMVMNPSRTDSAWDVTVTAIGVLGSGHHIWECGRKAATPNVPVNVHPYRAWRTVLTTGRAPTRSHRSPASGASGYGEFQGSTRRARQGHSTSYQEGGSRLGGLGKRPPKGGLFPC
jgi:hypothetical protein